MSYTTPDEIIGLYGEDALSRIADSDGDFQLDTDKIQRAIERADDEINAYIGVRYGLPLPSVPGHLKQLSSDIAVYRLATEAGGLTEEHRTRYEDAIVTLKRLSDGKAVLHFAPQPGDETEAEGGDAQSASADNSPRPIVTSGPDRLFSRKSLRDF